MYKLLITDEYVTPVDPADQNISSEIIFYSQNVSLFKPKFSFKGRERFQDLAKNGKQNLLATFEGSI